MDPSPTTNGHTVTTEPSTADPPAEIVPAHQSEAPTRVTNGITSEPVNGFQNGSGGRLNVQCGPLLRYIGQSEDGSLWRGSILIVAKAGDAPALSLKCVGAYKAEMNGAGHSLTAQPVKIYQDTRFTYWRYDLEIPLQSFEARWEYHLPGIHFLPGPRKATSDTHNFFVPSSEQSMRIMFHSCNGFSVGTDEEAWSGPALWNDVMRRHEESPFHVMIGGGDQIYNDGVRVNGPLNEWTGIHNPHKRRHFPFGEKLRHDCDDFYLNNYTRWYCTEPFSTANAQIAMVNIWDDHDIIDGFGSYTDRFMRCPVFLGIGSVAYKYYMLFQHHTAPSKATYTTDAPDTMNIVNGDGAGSDPVQEKDHFILKEKLDPSWILGAAPGPYMMQKSRSLYMRMGKRIAFMGLDARMERTRHTVNTPETYDLVFSRLNAELSKAKGEIKHLIVLLGVPIAYPRLVWMENLLTSPLIVPIRFLNKRFGVAGSLFNSFDGAVDILDDLDDHYTARHHKEERNTLILRLQEFSRQHSVRITILGGDVHLCAVGRFYSNPKLNIPTENDHRYIVNLISSAITNKPPPSAVANMLAKRNKIHHLNHDCDETLMNIFDKDAGEIPRTAKANKVTMPSRNYAIIAESHDEESLLSHVGFHNGNITNHEDPENYGPHHRKTAGKSGHEALHPGEYKAGTEHAAAWGAATGKGGVSKYGLSIALRVERDQHDREGQTDAFGFSIPALEPVKAG